MPVAESAHGIWTHPRHAAAWSAVRGASEAPKSTLRDVICAMPAPEPTAPYVTWKPYFDWKSCVHCAMSGATSVEPAPVMSAEALAANVVPAQAVAAISDAARRRVRLNTGTF